MDYIYELARIIGWIYFVAWTISFYPQTWTNFKRKSVVGLSFDLIALNLTGFTFYSIFNTLLYFVPIYRDAYHKYLPNSTVPVEVQDVFFAFHATFITIVTAIQCVIYEQGTQYISLLVKLFTILAWIIALALTLLAAFDTISILFQAYYFSYVKLFVTTVKYIPQAWLNYTRKSTIGWNIVNVLLDLTGGLFSILQMILIAYDNDDWINIFGNVPKFGLGMFSVLFDLLFIYQHYVLYKDSNSEQADLITNESQVANDQREQV